MSLNGFDNFSNDLSPQKICNLIELKYQPEILNLCNNINIYFSDNPFSSEIPKATNEMAYLLFNKLHDELRHLFLKEAGIVFPCILKWHINNNTVDNKNCLDSKVSETVHRNQILIIDLIEKIRILLNDFIIEPEWNNELKKCMARLFVLETKILEWVHIEQKFLYPKVTMQHKVYLHSINTFSVFSLN